MLLLVVAVASPILASDCSDVLAVFLLDSSLSLEELLCDPGPCSFPFTSVDLVIGGTDLTSSSFCTFAALAGSSGVFFWSIVLSSLVPSLLDGISLALSLVCLDTEASFGVA